MGGFGVPGTLTDPKIELSGASDGNQAPPFLTNDDWEDDDGASVAYASELTGGFALEAGSTDAAILIWLEPGTYTAKISGNNGGTGVGLGEIYEVP